MSGGYHIVAVAGSSSDVQFSSYDYVCNVDPLPQSERLFNAIQCAMDSPHCWRSRELVGQYVTDGMLPGRVPVRDLHFLKWDLRFFIPS